MSPSIESGQFRIGNTPLTRFEVRLNGLSHELCLKEERYNEFGSIKDRVAWYVLRETWSGEPTRQPVIDASSGNYGYALARIGQRLGIPVTIVSSPSITKFNAQGICLAGAQLVIAETEPGESSNAARMRVAGELAASQGGIFLDQYRNPLNPECHRIWTAPELFAQDDFDACFLAASSGGTARGFNDYLLESRVETRLVLVEPCGSNAFADAAPTDAAGPFIPGYGSGRRSSFAVLDNRPIILRVDEAELFATRTALESMPFPSIGLSSIGVVAGALSWLSKATQSSNVVCVCADGAERYKDDVKQKYYGRIDNDRIKTAMIDAQMHVSCLRALDIW